jgi:hypothetical protein
MTAMVEVTQEDANNYCRVLAALGLEEEGDPVAEIERLRAELARCGKDNCMGRKVQSTTTWVTWEAREAAVAAERERWEALAGNVCDARHRYGWSPEVDAEIEALRQALKA